MNEAPGDIQDNMTPLVTSNTKVNFVLEHNILSTSKTHGSAS